MNVPFSTMLVAGVVSLAGSASGVFPAGLHGFAWLHVEPRPVPELAWGGELHAKLGFSRSMRLAKAKLKLSGLPGCGRIQQAAEAT